MRDSQVRDSVSNLIVQLFRKVNREHNKALKPLGLSTLQAHILLVLWDSDAPVLVGELQRALSMGSSTITGALDRMEGLKLISREAVSGDRRAFGVQAAKWPKAKKDRVLDVMSETEDRCYGALSARERQTLLGLLRRVLVDPFDVADP